MSSSAAQEVSNFIDYLQQVRRYSSHTVLAYQKDLASFQTFCEQHGLDSWKKVSAHHIRQYSASLHRKGMGGRSIQRKLSSIRSFYRYLMRENLLDASPAEAVSAPKSPKKLPSAIDVDQINQLLQQGSDDPLVQRDLAMMELMYSSGLRLAELVGLNLMDLDLKTRTVKVTGKGGKSRILPVGGAAAKSLEGWLAARHTWLKGEETAVFISKRGTRISDRHVRHRMREWGIKNGVSGSLHPHRFRHSFASHLLESSGDIRAVQELLGHANISTTQIYTHLDFQHLASVYDKAHPRAKSKKTDKT